MIGWTIGNYRRKQGLLANFMSALPVVAAPLGFESL